MKTLIKLLLFILFFFGFRQSYSQRLNISFEHFQLEQDIPPIVPCILQDRTGYIWFGTYYGIYRYDGYSIVSYKPDENDTNSITNAVVEALCDDKEGNIWVGHAQGVDKFNPSTGRFTHYILNKNASLSDWSNHVLSILVDRNENLWVGTGDGLYLFDKNKENFKRFVHDSTDSGSLIQNSVNAIYEDRSGNLWFGTGRGLDKLDSSGKKFIHYWTDPEIPDTWGSTYWVGSIFEDKDGIIWLGTQNGLVEFDKTKRSFITYKNIPNDSKSLGNNSINSICQDKNGFIWISTDEGLDIFDNETKKFAHYRPDESDPSSISNYIAQILVVKARVLHLFQFRTEKLSPCTPMVLHAQVCGRVGSCQIYFTNPGYFLIGFFLFYYKTHYCF